MNYFYRCKERTRFEHFSERYNILVIKFCLTIGKNLNTFSPKWYKDGVKFNRA